SVCKSSDESGVAKHDRDPGAMRCLDSSVLYFADYSLILVEAREVRNVGGVPNMSALMSPSKVRWRCRPKTQAPEEYSPAVHRRAWPLLLLLAAYLVFCHGCHGDEDNELFVRATRTAHKVWPYGLLCVAGAS